MLEPFLISCWPEGLHLYFKQTPAQIFSYEFCEILKSNNFEEHLQMASTVDSFAWFHL